MRNLKRALSLALASVMLLGMMVVGTSAASYPDVDENDNVEAIEVLNAVQVMIGDRGNFRPDAKVNRHEMAVIMAKLVLGNEAADNYVGSHPFTDVFPWADKYVAACYENGLVSGTSATTFSGNQPLTAVQAAAMMLRALGYKDLSKGATDWRAPVTAMANQIRLFSGVASNPKEELDRNQVAQLALNTLKSSVVDMKEGLSITGSNGDYTFTVDGNREYIVRSSLDSYARAISAVEQRGNSASGVGGYTVELGEHLYNGKLTLVEDNVDNWSVTDDFGRPARHWEYDGKEIGTYAKTELMRAEYTTKVTGKMLYDLLGSSTIRDFGLDITIDGVPTSSTLGDANFGRADMIRTNTDAVGATGNGVLTQVFVDGVNKEIDIAIINTYLAIADSDYSASKDEVSLTVHNLDKSSNTYFKDTDGTKDAEPLKVAGDDFDIKDVKKDDKFLVTVADGEIKSMAAPEVVSEQTITSHKVDKYVVADKQYDYATTAQYDTEVMEDFGSVDMKEVTYDIFLDKYGYLIGVEQNEKVNQYVFLTGVDDEYSHLSQKNVPANVIFLDGTMKTVTINAKDSVLWYDIDGNGNRDASDYGHGTTGYAPSRANMWCTYSVDSNDIYTLKAVSGYTRAKNKVTNVTAIKVAQDTMDADTAAEGNSSSEIKINSKNISLDGRGTVVKVHGNADTVYINTKMANIDVPQSGKSRIVDDVDSITTGVTNVSLIVKDRTKANEGATAYDVAKNEVYTLYKDNGTIIAVVTLEAEDEATNKSYAYINSGNIDHRDYDASTKEYSWYRQAVVNGEFVMLKEVDDETASDYLNTDVMEKGKWYEIKYNGDGEVRGIVEVTYPSTETDDTTYDAADKPSGNTNPAGDEIEIGIHYMRNANHVANLLDKTFILNADYHTNANVELKYAAGTLYVGNDATKGVYIDPNAKVVVFTRNYDKHEEFSGKDMEKALSALVDKKSFDGYVNAVIGDDGVADVVILDEKNMNNPDTYSVSFSDLSHVTSPAGNISGIAKNGSAVFTVTAKSGWVVNNVTADGGTLSNVGDVYTLSNITSNITVTISTSRDGNAYDGEVVFDTTTKTAVTAEWTGAAEPTEAELASLLIDELVRQGYDKSTASITSLTSTDITIKIKKTINGVAGPEETFTMNKSTGLNQVEEISTSEALADKITAGSTTKVKLTGSATVTTAPTMDIVVDTGNTLTLNGAISLTNAITGAGSVAATNNIGAAEKIAVTGGISVDANHTLTVAADWAIPGNVTGAGKIAGVTFDITNGARIQCTGGLTLSTGSVDTLSSVPLEVTGAVTSLTAGRVAPSALTFTGAGAAITLNSAAAELVVPANATIGALTITDGKMTLAGNATVADGKAVTITDAADFATFKLTGGTGSTVVFGASPTITGFTAADQNFYNNADTDKVTAISSANNKTCTWSATAGGTGNAGWKLGV